METLLLGFYYLSLVVSFVCVVWVAFAFAEQHGLFAGLLAFFCCGIILFFWGWFFWKSESKLMVMIVWTLAQVVAAAIHLTVIEPIEM